jgi:hypothetical protein
MSRQSIDPHDYGVQMDKEEFTDQMVDDFGEYTRGQISLTSRRRTLLIASAAAFVVLAGLVVAYLITAQQRFERINAGMTRQDVVAVLGPPKWVDRQTECWESAGLVLVVRFKNDEVVFRQYHTFVLEDRIRKTLQRFGF